MWRQAGTLCLNCFNGKRRWWLLGLLAIPLVMFVLSARHPADAAAEEEHAETHSPSTKEPPLGRLIHPERRDITRIVGQPSFVEAYERTSIYPKVTGYIKKWNVDIGDPVKKGDVLATLYVPELVEMWETKKSTVVLDQEKVELARKVVLVAKANVMAAEARLKETKEILEKFNAQMDRWKSEVDRLGREVQRGVVDPQVLLESQNQLRASTAAWYAAQASVEKAEADLLSMQTTEDQDDVAVRVAEADLKVAESEAKRLAAWVSYLDLIAPYDGIVTARNANTWDFVAPKVGDPSTDAHAPHLSPDGSAAPIYVVDRVDVVRIFMDVPERDAKFVQAGAPASVYIRAFRDHAIPAKVTRTSWALNVKSRTLRAEIDLQNTEYKTVPGTYHDTGNHSLATENGAGKNPQILPGMYAYANVMIERKDVTALPVRAIFAQGDTTFCWMYINDHAHKTEVRTELSDGEWVEITNYRKADGSWSPFQGNEQIVFSDDLGLLTEGGQIRMKSASADAGVENQGKAMDEGHDDQNGSHGEDQNAEKDKSLLLESGLR